MKKFVLSFISALVLLHCTAQPNTWTSKMNFAGQVNGPQGLGGGRVFVIGTTAYFCGNGEMWAYDGNTGLWSQRALFPLNLRTNAVAFTIGAYGYLGSGDIATLTPGVSNFWRYDPATDTWIERAVLPGGSRTLATGFAINGSGYIGSGRNSSNQEMDDFYAYDPTTDTWTQKANMPGAPREGATGFSLNGLGYIAGGVNYPDLIEFNDCWSYDPLADAWTQRASMAMVHIRAPGFTLGDSLYVCSGTLTVGGEMERYDPSTDSWAFVPSVPGGDHSDAASFAINGMGYIGRGSATPDFVRYDPILLQWSTLTLPDGDVRVEAVTFTIADKGYVCTGRFGSGVASNEVWEYDPTADTWTQRASFPGAARYGAAGFAIGGKGYVGGGANLAIPVVYSDFWEYDPALDQWTQKANLPGPAKHHCGSFAVNGKGYVGGGTDASFNTLTTFHSYDPVTDSWAARANVPGGTSSGIGTFVIGSLGYFCFPIGQLNAYDPVTDSWSTKASRPSPLGDPLRDGLFSFSAAGRGYVGSGAHASVYFRDVYEYSGMDDAWRTCATFPSFGRMNAPAFGIGDRGYVGDTDFWSYQPSDELPTGTPFAQIGIFCANASVFFVPVEVLGAVLNPGNILSAQLSDANGDFTSPTVLGTLASVSTNIIVGAIPVGTPPGTNYRTRVVSSDPVIIGPPNANPFIIYEPSVYYHDQDNDGAGDPDDSAFVCIPPSGYVTNNLDDCPTLYGLIGQPCTDPYNYTFNDIITPECECHGLYGFQLTMDVRAGGSELTWEIVEEGTSNMVLNGPAVPYADNTMSYEPIYLRGEHCYELLVHDSGGNGMGAGGYMLTNHFGQPVIENMGNGAFGSLSNIGYSKGFCTPAGSDRPTTTSCNTAEWHIDDVIRAEVNPAVSAEFGIDDQTDDGYQFWFFNPNGGYSRRIFRDHASSGDNGPANAVRATKLKLSSMITQPLPYDMLLNICVRSKVNGVFAPFGKVCRFTLVHATSTPTTQLETAPGPHYSCGVSKNLLGWDRVWAHVVSRTLPGGGAQGANKYQFEWKNTDLNYTRTIASTNASLLLNVWGTLPLTECTSYDVRVRASFDNGQTWCPWGAACSVFIVDALNCYDLLAGQQRSAASGVSHHVLIHPSPSNGDRIHLSVNGLADTGDLAMVSVYDLTGRLMHSERIPIALGALDSELTFDRRLGAGLYETVIEAGVQRITSRFVVE
ncbi:MAG: kelch repeat-containing protein [Flavobacteriales bacterium]